MMQKEKQKKQHMIIWIILLVMSILAAVSKIVVGFDIDEGYALALPYRLLQGDRLFTDMWEVHQTSSLFAAVILAPYLAIAGQTAGIVLYTRIVCTILHFLMSIFVYRTLGSRIKKEQALFLSFIYFNFLPKWMMSVDFSIQFTWFFTICILCFLRAEYDDKEKNAGKINGWMFLNGISLALLVLGYPSMVVLYPVFLAVIIVRKEWDKKNKTRAALWLTAGCAALAIPFLAWLFSYMSFSQLLENIPNVFSDGSHQFDAAAKWSLWLNHIKDVVVQTMVTLIPAVVLTFLCQWFEKKMTGSEDKKEKLSFPVMLASIYICLTSLIVILANVLQVAWGPFRLQIRYIVMFVLGFFMIRGQKDEKKAKLVRSFCLVSSLAAFAGILLASNVGPTSSSSYLVVGVMAVLYLLMISVQYEENEADTEKVTKASGANAPVVLVKAAMLLFLISLIMCKGYYVRVTGYPPSNITEKRMQIAEGPAKGIWVHEKEYEDMTETYEMVTKYTNEEDRVLYLGTQALSNLYTKGRPVLPTTISTPAFNEQWIHYFELHEDKMPTVIFLSKTTVDDQEKFFAKNPFGLWIREHYDVDNRIDAEYLCIIR